MLGLEDYGSDSDASDSNAPVQPKPKPSKKPTQKRKVAIALPSFKQQPVDEEEREEESEPAPKKPRLAAGAGVSGLLSMLPAPKQKAVVLPKPERVLGGGSGPGLVFNRSNNEQSSSSLDAEPEPPSSFNFESSVSDDTSVSTLFRPSSVNTKGRSNISLEGPTPSSKPKPAPAVSTPAPAHEDFFSLAITGSSAKPSTSKHASTSTPTISKPTFSAAPAIPTFEAPEPTPTDPYPGYYQLPSGSWAQHDVTYYNSFAKKWQDDYNAQIRAMEKGQSYEKEDMEEVNAQKEMELAKIDIKLREDRKALTTGGSEEVQMPKMKITAAKQSGVARSRHQLSTMLMEAYTNRDALEEKIAEGRRNRKEAGNKYGF